MNRIILTTSSSGLDNYDIQHDVELIRLHLNINDTDYVDGRGLNVDELNNIMNKALSVTVKTSPATVIEITKMFADLYARGYSELFIITLSSQLSESYEIISQVAKRFANQLNIHIYDSKDLNTCEALLALEADHLLKMGFSFVNIAKHLDKLRNSHKMLFAVNDLSYLVLNKKISNFSGFVGDLIDIKPILTVTDDGTVVPDSKVRHISNSLEYIIDHFYALSQSNESFYPYILTGGDNNLNSYLINLVKQKFNVDHVPIFKASSISIANHGPFAVGLCAFSGYIPFITRQFEF